MFNVLVPTILGLCLSHSTAIGQTCMTIANDDGEPGVFNVTVPNDFSQQNVSKGGDVGSFGIGYVHPSTTPVDNEPPIGPFDSTLTSSLSVDVSCSGQDVLPAGASTTVLCTIKNRGTKPDIYTISSVSSVGWADFSQLPKEVNLASGASVSVAFGISVPSGTEPGITETFSVAATSHTNPLLVNSGLAFIAVTNSDSTKVSTRRGEE